MWHECENEDTGSLKVGRIDVQVGDQIEIRDEGRLRTVTYIMGQVAAGTLCVCFKGQGAVPTGDIAWRKISNGLPPSLGQGDSPRAAYVDSQDSKSTGDAFNPIDMPKFLPAKPVLLIAFDSAWTANNRGGMAIVLAAPGGLTTILAPMNCSFGEAEKRVADVIRQGLADRVILALDQPLIVANEEGRRPVDGAASRVVGKFCSAVQPASLKRSQMFGPESPISLFLKSVEALGIELDMPVNIDPEGIQMDGVHILEVYPVMATLALFPTLIDRGEVARYNPQRKKTFRHDDWVSLCKGLGLVFGNIGMGDLQQHCNEAASGNVTKGAQDLLDGCICMLIAWCLLAKFPCALLGDMDNGYMVTPYTETLGCYLKQGAEIEGIRLRLLPPAGD